jgi:2,4-diaminopentanoate dehydrogenase
METIGIVNNQKAIVIEHVNRMVPDIAPDWPVAAIDGTYRIRIEGDPDIACEMTVGDPESPTAGGMTATAMRVVNAIPFVVDADPGLITSLDIPLTLPRGILGVPAGSGG